jgi:hypothetical protein
MRESRILHIKSFKTTVHYTVICPTGCTGFMYGVRGQNVTRVFLMSTMTVYAYIHQIKLIS